MATSDIVALQTDKLVVVSLLLSVQEAVVVVEHVFGFSHAEQRDNVTMALMLRQMAFLPVLFLTILLFSSTSVGRGSRQAYR